MKRFQFGICEWCMPPLGPSVCRFAAKYGLDGIALDMGSVSDGIRLSDPEIRAWYMEESAGTGVVFCALALNVLSSFDLIHTGPDDGKIRTIFSQAVQAAAEMKIPVIQVPNFPCNDMRSMEQMRVMAGRFQEACDEAAGYGILIGTENTLGAKENRVLMEMVDRPNFRVYFDTANPYFFHFGSSPRMLEELIGDICQIHVKDGTEKELSLTPLGEGLGEFDACARGIRASSYRGWIILENEYKAWGRDNGGLLMRDIETLRQAFPDEE